MSKPAGVIFTASPLASYRFLVPTSLFRVAIAATSTINGRGILIRRCWRPESLQQYCFDLRTCLTPLLYLEVAFDAVWITDAMRFPAQSVSAWFLIASWWIAFSAAQYDPLRDFCRRWGHQTAVVDDRLYIDGGFVNWKPFSASSENYTSQ